MYLVHLVSGTLGSYRFELKFLGGLISGEQEDSTENEAFFFPDFVLAWYLDSKHAVYVHLHHLLMTLFHYSSVCFGEFSLLRDLWI